MARSHYVCQVVLRLVAAEKDPMEFPYLDPPDRGHLAAATDVLMRLGCIRDHGDGSGLELSNAGRLFNELPFDPRNCSFVLEGLTGHGIGPLCIKVAALRSAPGAVFFFGKKDDVNGKKAAEADLARRAANFDSDLLFEVSAYNEWVRAGLRVVPGAPAEQRGCHCQGRGKGKAGCTRCRKAYSTEHFLNNRVLEAVHATVSAVERELSQPKWKGTIAKRMQQLTAGTLERINSASTPSADIDGGYVPRALSKPVDYDADGMSDAVSSMSVSSIASSIANSASAPASEAGSDVGRLDDLADGGDGIQYAPSAETLADSTGDDARKLGDCLLHAFPEQVGAFIVPGFADSGIRLLQPSGVGGVALLDVKAKVDRSSTVHHQARKNQQAKMCLFAVMDSQQMPTGLVVARKLHPITGDQLPFPDPPVEALRVENVGKWPATQVKEELEKETNPASWKCWAAALYDAHDSTLTVYVLPAMLIHG